MNDAKALFKGNLTRLGDHMGNFFEGFKHNLPVISDVESQHRSASFATSAISRSAWAAN